MKKGYLDKAIRARGLDLIHALIPDIGSWKTTNGGDIAVGNCPWRPGSNSMGFHVGLAVGGPMGLGGWKDYADANSGDLFTLAGMFAGLDPKSDFPALLEWCSKLLSMDAKDYVIAPRKASITECVDAFYATDAEDQLVGHLIDSTEGASEVVTELGSHDYFTIPLHRWAYVAVERLLKHGMKIDPAVVLSALAAAGRIKDNNSELLDYPCLGQTDRIPALAMMLKQAAGRRKLYEIGQRLQLNAASPERMDPDALVDEAQKDLGKIGGINGPKVLSIDDQVDQTTEHLNNVNAGERRAIPSGFPGYDQKARGLEQGELIIVAGRPGMGKSSVAVTTCLHVAVHQNLPTVVITLEMPARQWLMRMAAHEACVSTDAMQRVGLNTASRKAVDYALAQFKKAPLTIHDKPIHSMADVRRIIRSAKTRYGTPALVILDHAHRISSDQKETSQILHSFALGCKDIALEDENVFMLLAQLSRASARRDEKRPQLDDLRECGALEENADVVLFPYRPDYYRLKGNVPPPPLSVAELILAKKREGETGSIPVQWNANLAKYVSS